MRTWFQKLGRTVETSAGLPAETRDPTFLEKVTAPIRRKTVERHPDDPGCWEYPEPMTQAELDAACDWLNNPRGWRRLR
jgi:hypothetical protein